MQQNGGHLIRHLRKQMGVSQEELAQKLFMKQRTLSNIEKGAANLSAITFKTAFALLGLPTADFWLASLNVNEFEGYLQYRDMKNLVAKMDIDNLREALFAIKQSPLAKRPFISQFIAYVELVVDDEMHDTQKLAALYCVLGQNSPPLNYNEVLLINDIALTHERLGDTGRAIAMLDDMVKNIDHMHLSLPEKKAVLPKPHIDLATLLIDTGQYKEAAKTCEHALEMIKQLCNMRLAPIAAKLLGICCLRMGREQQEYMHWLCVAYHTAKSTGQHELAAQIQEEYGVS